MVHCCALLIKFNSKSNQSIPNQIEEWILNTRESKEKYRRKNLQTSFLFLASFEPLCVDDDGCPLEANPRAGWFPFHTAFCLSCVGPLERLGEMNKKNPADDNNNSKDDDYSGPRSLIARSAIMDFFPVTLSHRRTLDSSIKWLRYVSSNAPCVRGSFQTELEKSEAPLFRRNVQRWLMRIIAMMKRFF